MEAPDKARSGARKVGRRIKLYVCCRLCVYVYVCMYVYMFECVRELHFEI